MRRPFLPETSHRDWKQRLNRALGEINAVLVALAIGLAVLDITCFVAFSVVTELRHGQGAPQHLQSRAHEHPEWCQSLSTPGLANAPERSPEPR